MLFFRDAPGALNDPIDNLFGLVMLVVFLFIAAMTVFIKLIDLKEWVQKKASRGQGP